MIAVEVLRVFEPDVYKKVCVSKQYLTEKYDDKQKEEYKQIFDAVLQSGSKEKAKALQKILSIMFFNVSKIYEDDLFGEGAERLLKYSRISHPEVFDRYFYFKTPVGDIANSEMEMIISSTDDKNVLLRFLKEHKDKGQLKVLLDRISNYIDDISLQNAESFITALFDIAENLPEEEAFTIGEKSHITRIFRNLLLRESILERRYEIFIECIRKTSGIYMPLYLVHGEDLRHESKNSPDRYIVEDHRVDDLKKECVAKIQKLADSMELVKNSACFFILYLWNKWGDADRVKEFVINTSVNDQIFASIVFSACHTVVSSSGNEVRRKYEINLKYFEDIFGIEYLNKKLADISMDKIDANGKKGLETLVRALKRREPGKSDDDFDDD